MMPQLVTVHLGSGGRPLRLWIPVLPVFVLLSPVLLVVLFVITIACLAYRINPVRALGAGWHLLCALPGTRIEIDQGRTRLLVSIS